MVIHPSQSAFILGRLITDNAMIAFEVFHSMKNRMHRKKGFATLKLDMSKAYDCIEWDFLKCMLVKMEFHMRFVDLLMLCVSTVSYQVVCGN